MGKAATLPTYGAALVDAGGRASAEYYRYFQSLNTNLFNYNAIEAQIDDLQSRVPALTSDVLGIDSVASSGHLSRGTVRVSLLNDVANPAKTQYYGTDSTSTHGWYSLYNVAKAEVIGSANVTVTPDDTAQTLTVDLADLADSGVAASLVRVAFDAKGRRTGTHEATTDDLTEGATNLYFTDARAQAIVDASSGVPTSVPTATTYLVPSDRQVLWTIPIELVGTASLDISGALVEVS